VIGLPMVVLPFAISLPSKANAGQSMLDNFRPMMKPANVSTTVTYFDHVFKPLGSVSIGTVQATKEEPAMIAALARQLHMTPAQLQVTLSAQFPAMGKMLASLPALTPLFVKVPPGLAWYQPQITTMQNNVDNYAQVDSLPNFRLLTWFFVVPGALLMLISAYGLGAFQWIGRHAHAPRHPAPTH
jgi:hypothetical protein